MIKRIIFYLKKEAESSLRFYKNAIQNDKTAAGVMLKSKEQETHKIKQAAPKNSNIWADFSEIF